MCDICDHPRDRQMRGFRWIDGKVTLLTATVCAMRATVVVDEIKDYILTLDARASLGARRSDACVPCEAT